MRGALGRHRTARPSMRVDGSSDRATGRPDEWSSRRASARRTESGLQARSRFLCSLAPHFRRKFRRRTGHSSEITFTQLSKYLIGRQFSIAPRSQQALLSLCPDKENAVLAGLPCPNLFRTVVTCADKCRLVGSSALPVGRRPMHEAGLPGHVPGKFSVVARCEGADDRPREAS
jgi:hypothetical protein